MVVLLPYTIGLFPFCVYLAAFEYLCARASPMLKSTGTVFNKEGSSGDITAPELNILSFSYANASQPFAQVETLSHPCLTEKDKPCLALLQITFRTYLAIRRQKSEKVSFLLPCSPLATLLAILLT